MWRRPPLLQIQFWSEAVDHLSDTILLLPKGIHNSDNISNQTNNMQSSHTPSRAGMTDRVLTIGEMIERAGDRNIYQFKMIFHFMMVFLFSSFIQMGFPIIFQPAKFICADGLECTEEQACASG